MKKSLKKVLGILLFSIVVISFSSAQEKTIFSLEREIFLRNDSEKKEIKIEVKEKGYFHLDIKSVLTQGEVKIEIYNPSGKKQGNFSVECQVPATEEAINFLLPTEKVTGNYRKIINNPTVGIWKVKITSINATGNVNIKYTQDSNN